MNPLQRIHCLVLLSAMASAGWGVAVAFGQAGPAFNEEPLVNTVSQIKALDENPGIGCRFFLSGQVWWVDLEANRMVFHDASGATGLEFNPGNSSFHAGDQITIQGHATVYKTGVGYRLGVLGPVVDNNGTHSMLEKSGKVYLESGRQPFRLEWFNGVKGYGLKVEYEGPDGPRGEIPDSALFQHPNSSKADGLQYSIYDVEEEDLPEFKTLPELARGVITHLGLPTLPHPEHIGVVFNGWLEVARTGFYTFFTTSDDGSQLWVGDASLSVRVQGHEALPKPRECHPGEALSPAQDWQWARVEGRVTYACRHENGWDLELTSGNNRMDIRLSGCGNDAGTKLLGRRVRVTGVCEGARTVDGEEVAGTLFVDGKKAMQILADTEVGQASQATSGSLPLLTTAAQIHRLKREEAQRGYPVRLTGVVTCVLPEHQAFTLQDETRGMYVVDSTDSRPFLPNIGERLEVSGTTDPSLFAPIVNAHAVRSLGAGVMPNPVQPTWDQLLNGSLDGQYVELQGVITTFNSTNVALFTRSGPINLDLRVAGLSPATMAGERGALVRVRGCLFANWDYVTHEVRVGEIRMDAASLSVSEPPPPDPFALPEKSVSDLMKFDPQASVLQRVKVRGQVEQARGQECFLYDGHNALRVETDGEPGVDPGDWVEASGFPELTEAGPLLREAVLRRMGWSPLPAAVKWQPGDSGASEVEAMRVRVSGVLAGIRKSAGDWVLEIQCGVRSFAARLGTQQDLSSLLPVGSRLELTGVWSSLATDGMAPDRGASSPFELLVGTVSDIHVLARPPWWTLTRLLFIMGVLGCGLAFTGLWISQLRRKVEERTLELGEQIKERQRVEQQRALERERARVARDLHDELGSGLTEIGMLGNRARNPQAPEERRREYIEQMGSRAVALVAALDEIVWAVNPQHDSLASLVSYFCLYADRFLGLASLNWKLESGGMPEGLALDPRRRHQLFLVFKEALTNVVRHAQATQVCVGIHLKNGALDLSVSDNGNGLAGELPRAGMDGLASMRSRVEKLGGHFEVISIPQKGTQVRITMPLQGPQEIS